MRVLIIQWKSFGHEDIVEAYNELGYSITCFPFDSHGELHHDEQIEAKLIEKIQDFHPDYVFSFNYFPIISLACKQAGTKYVSWVYDSPQVLLYSYTIIHPCNYIFTFDQAQYISFRNQGINTFYYLPLAANTTRLSKMSPDDANFQASKWKNQTDIAFIGSLYNEAHNFYSRLKDITPHTRGYLEGLIAAQKKVYGYNFIEEALQSAPQIIEDMSKSLPMTPSNQGVETKEFLFGQYVINRRITELERLEFLSAIGQKYKYDLYTQDENALLPGAINHGKVDYYDMAPYVFKNAKINLNISLRSITSGIPLRCFDILGSGGFLLTNYQSDFEGLYVPNEDYAYYDSTESLMSQIEYYLSHEQERAEIARNGFEKTKKNHTYQHKIEIIETIIKEDRM